VGASDAFLRTAGANHPLYPRGVVLTVLISARESVDIRALYEIASIQLIELHSILLQPMRIAGYRIR
jgi:hypothetical protein